MRIRVTLAVLLALVAIAAYGDNGVASPGTIMRVSTASDGGQGYDYSCCPSMTPDARFVSFTSANFNLVGADSNWALDVFVKDTQTGETSRVSVGPSERQTDLNSYQSAISADGRFVAFESAATNLVNFDTNSSIDIFVRDRQRLLTSRVSVAGTGEQGGCRSSSPAISGDGRFVAFESCSSNLVPEDANNVCDNNGDGIVAENCPDVFIHDRDADGDGIYDEPGAIATTIASVATGGAQGNDLSALPAISGDGRYVGFFSYAYNLVPDDTNNAGDVFVHDRVLGITSRVSVDSAGNQSNGYSFSITLNSDGRFAAFYSYASNLVSGDTNTHPDVFVHDSQTGETTRVSVDSAGGQGDDGSGYCCYPISMSANGQFVAFQSYASNLAAHFAYTPLRILVHDRGTGITVMASVDSVGAAAAEESSAPVISGDGRFVAFDSWASLVPEDFNQINDVYVRDLGDSDADGVWDPFEPDADGDAVLSITESRCGSDPSNATSRPERIDTLADDDGDTLVNEALPPGSEIYDCDGDGYAGTREANATTSDQDPCGGSGWPSDLLPGGLFPNTLTVQDVGSFVTPVRRLGTSLGDTNFSARWDLVPGSVVGATINVQDIVATTLGTTGYPPMFGGQRAFGRPCPYAP